MRAEEFITEARRGKMNKVAKNATPGMTTFRDPDGVDRTYALNRVMMAAAMSDGSGKPVDMDTASWADKNNLATPYTDVEDRMMDAAYKAVGVKRNKVAGRKSQEADDVHTTSPTKGFKGYFDRKTQKTRGKK